MIRHSKSFFISIVIHIILFMSILYTWDHYISAKSVNRDTLKECDKISVELCNINPKKVEKPQEEKKPLEKPKPKKKIIKKEIFVKKKKIEPKVEKVNPEPLIETNKELELNAAVVEITEEVEDENKIDDVKPKQMVIQKSKAELDKERKIKQKSLTNEYIKINTQEIAALLRDNLYYPRSARKRNITGEVTVKFTLGLNSDVSDVEVVKSNSDILSRAAVKTIEDLSGEFPRPSSVITLIIPIGYELN